MNYRAMASCVFGLEALVSRELRDLGLEVGDVKDGRVFFEADEEGIALSNIWLRTAERVYIVLDEFEAEDSEELYQNVRAMPWGDYIERDSAFPVDVNLIKTSSNLASKSVTQKTVKRAIVDCLRPIYRTEFFEETGAERHILVHILKSRALVLLDTSGAGLNRRGYREYGNKAPLRETLAAALVMLSRWKGDVKLVDPFCGSGTILIEAALYALGRAPNVDREFPFEKWKAFRGVDRRALAEFEFSGRLRGLCEGSSIEGYDIDASAIKQARINAKKAGVADFIHLQTRPVEEFSSSAQKGTIISNLPYGERLSSDSEVSKLNRRLGEIMSGYPLWKKYFLTAHEGFEDEYGKKADKNRKLYNGGIKSYLYMYFKNGLR